MKYIIYRVPDGLKPENHKAIIGIDGKAAATKWYKKMGERAGLKRAVNYRELLKRTEGGKYVIVAT